MSRHRQPAARPHAATADGAVDAFARGVLAEIERGEEPLLVWSKDVRQVLDELANPKPSTARLSQLVALDPRLAVTTMGVAQSTTFGRLATPSLDLQQTLFALGPDRLRCIVLGAGVAQLPEQPRLQQWRREVQAIGASAYRTAAISMLAARAIGGIESTDAFLLGMMHGVGKFCLYARLRGADEWQADLQQRLLLVSRWHVRIGAAMVRGWSLGGWLADAVASQDLLGRDTAGAGDMRGELLAAAIVAARTAHAIDETAGHLAEFSRVGLDAAAWRDVLAGVPATTDSLRALLSG